MLYDIGLPVQNSNSESVRHPRTALARTVKRVRDRLWLWVSGYWETCTGHCSGSNRRKGCGKHHHQELRTRQINAVNLRNKDGRDALHNRSPIHIDRRPQRHRKSSNTLINTQTFFNRSQCHRQRRP